MLINWKEFTNYSFNGESEPVVLTLFISISSSLKAKPIFWNILQFDPIVKCRNKRATTMRLRFCRADYRQKGQNEIGVGLQQKWNIIDGEAMQARKFIDYLCKFSQQNIPFPLHYLTWVICVLWQQQPQKAQYFFLSLAANRI